MIDFIVRYSKFYESVEKQHSSDLMIEMSHRNFFPIENEISYENR